MKVFESKAVIPSGDTLHERGVALGRQGSVAKLGDSRDAEQLPLLDLGGDGYIYAPSRIVLPPTARPKPPVIALGQMDVTYDPRKNVARMTEMAREARDKGAEVIAFPECSVKPYLSSDLWTDEGYCVNAMAYDPELLALSGELEMGIVWGNVHLDYRENMEARGIRGKFPTDKQYFSNEDGRFRQYNAVRVAVGGQWAQRLRPTSLLPAGVAPKSLGPKYRVFDDERFWLMLSKIAQAHGVPIESLLQPFVFDLKSGRHHGGVDTCEGLWCGDYAYNNGVLNPTKMLIENGANWVINISCSPSGPQKEFARDRRVAEVRDECEGGFVPFFYVNNVGVQNKDKLFIPFDGLSTAYNEKAEPVQIAPQPFQEVVLVVHDITAPPIVRQQRSWLQAKLGDTLQGMKALQLPKYLVGGSGGIDSSIVEALAVMAYGRERVMVVGMPFEDYNSDDTKHCAADTARVLGIPYQIVPIDTPAQATIAWLNSVDLDSSGTVISGDDEENVLARFRGAGALAGLAAKYKGIYLNTGNKLELATGYFTLYGDGGGGLAVIGDWLKAELFDLARHLNDHFGDEVVSERLIPDRLFRFGPNQIFPTAELRPGQKQRDPFKFGYHDAVLNGVMNYKKASEELFLERFLNGSLHDQLKITDITPDEMLTIMDGYRVTQPETFVNDLEDFIRKIRSPVFKRWKTPGTILSSKSAFGGDYRESIVPYQASELSQALRAKVLGHGPYRPT